MSGLLDFTPGNSQKYEISLYLRLTCLSMHATRCGRETCERAQCDMFSGNWFDPSVLQQHASALALTLNLDPSRRTLGHWSQLTASLSVRYSE